MKRVAGVMMVCLLAAAGGHAQTGSPAEPVRYMGGLTIDPSAHDGRLRPAIGVESREVMRANRTHPDQADGFGWTYNHAPMLAFWAGRFYLEYLSNPVGEHIPPGQTLVSTSPDGRSWTRPQVLFPPYKLRQGGEGMMHQRMGFYVAPNQRLLVLAFYAYAPDPFGKGGIGRVVREAHRDGTFGPIYFIRYNSWVGWNQSNTNFPLYTASPDRGFIEACQALLADKLKTMQWWEEDRSQDGLYTVSGLEAPSVYHRKDGLAVALWKWSHGALSADQGASWTPPVSLPTLHMDGAKVWGQRTTDGRYALVYNPINDTNNRWPLAIVTGDDGIHFDNMLLVNGEVPPKRHLGLWKDWGSMYVRGISEGNGIPPSNDLWVTYSVTKEDIWISRIPVPVHETVSAGPIHDTFDRMAVGGPVAGWNIYSPKWAPVGVAAFPSQANKSLELQDRDPYNYAKAVRVFPQSRTVELTFNLYSRQADAGGDLEIEVLDRYGNRPVRLQFTGAGRIIAVSGSAAKDVAAYRPNTWHTVGLTVRTRAGNYTLSIDGKPVLTSAAFAESVYTVERLSFRTGPFRTEPTRAMDPEKVPVDLPNADEPVPDAVYYLDDVAIVTAPGRQPLK
jgi:hypothetical protein